MKIFNKIQAEQFLTKHISNDIRTIANAMSKFDIFVVGGCVRDAFFGIEPNDFDIATNALPDDVQKALSDNNIVCEPRGVEFGVVVAKLNGEEYEIATFREDISGGTGNLMDDSVRIGVSIETDVNRRDLTINALFFDLNTNTIVDLVGGIDDIQNGIIRTVGNPIDRFEEDSTRKLRIVRFASRFNFSIDSKTIDAIKDNSELLCNNERITKELLKIFDADADVLTIRKSVLLLNDLGLIQSIFDDCNLVNGFDVERICDLNTFMAVVLNNDIDTLDRAMKVVNIKDIYHSVKLLWMFNDNKKPSITNVHKLLERTTVTKESLCAYTMDDTNEIYFDTDIPKIIKKANKLAINCGLVGKEISEFTKQYVNSEFS